MRAPLRPTDVLSLLTAVGLGHVETAQTSDFLERGAKILAAANECSERMHAFPAITPVVTFVHPQD